MKKLVGCQRGITLVEVLAVLAIGSIFLLIAVNVYVSAQEQYDKQSREANSLVDVTYATKVLTKEIRQNPNNVGVKSESSIKIGDNEYTFESNSILRNGTTFVDNINHFNAEMNGNQLRLLIISSSGQKVETNLVIRRGGGTEMVRFIRNHSRNQDGYTLIGVVIILLIISVLGVSILTVTSNTLKISSAERENQSAYYIAEAGINKKLANIEANINDEWQMDNTYYDFEEVLGEQPISDVVVNEDVSKSTDTNKYYTITSTGIIGDERRTVMQGFFISRTENNNTGNNVLLDLAALSKNTPNLGNNNAKKKYIIGDLGIINGDIGNLGDNVDGNIVKMDSYPKLQFPINIPGNCKKNEPVNFVQSDCINYDKEEFVISDQNTSINLGNLDENKILFVNDLTIDGKLKLSGKGRLTIYVKGNLKFGKGNGKNKYTINENGSPNKIDIFLKSSNQEVIEFKNTTINASIYAEDTNLKFKNSTVQGIIFTERGKVDLSPGKAKIYGTVIADELVTGNSEGIHIQNKRFEDMEGPIYDKVFGKSKSETEAKKTIKLDGAIHEI